MYSMQMKQILNQCKGEKRMDEKINLKAIKALKEFRDAMYDGLSKDEQKRVDKKEIEYGAEAVARMFSKMHPISIACILRSVMDTNPKIITDIVDFGDFIDKSFDIFGAEKTAKMISLAMDMTEEDLKKKLEEDIIIEKKLKEMNGEPEEKEEPKEETPEEVKELIDLFKSGGFDVVIKEVKEKEDD